MYIYIYTHTYIHIPPFGSSFQEGWSLVERSNLWKTRELANYMLATYCVLLDRQCRTLLRVVRPLLKSTAYERQHMLSTYIYIYIYIVATHVFKLYDCKQVVHACTISCFVIPKEWPPPFPKPPWHPIVYRSIYLYLSIYLYIYIYIERERDIMRLLVYLSLSLSPPLASSRRGGGRTSKQTNKPNKTNYLGL